MAKDSATAAVENIDFLIKRAVQNARRNILAFEEDAVCRRNANKVKEVVPRVRSGILYNNVSESDIGSKASDEDNSKSGRLLKKKSVPKMTKSARRDEMSSLSSDCSRKKQKSSEKKTSKSVSFQSKSNNGAKNIKKYKDDNLMKVFYAMDGKSRIELCMEDGRIVPMKISKNRKQKVSENSRYGKNIFEPSKSDKSFGSSKCSRKSKGSKCSRNSKKLVRVMTGELLAVRNCTQLNARQCPLPAKECPQKEKNGPVALCPKPQCPSRGGPMPASIDFFKSSVAVRDGKILHKLNVMGQISEGALRTIIVNGKEYRM